MLPELQRDIFIRHRVRGQTIAEIATAIDLETRAVEDLLASALITISDALDRLD